MGWVLGKRGWETITWERARPRQLFVRVQTRRDSAHENAEVGVRAPKVRTPWPALPLPNSLVGILMPGGYAVMYDANYVANG